MFLAPPLKSSAAIRAASTEPMPLVSWKMPEISLSTPTRTTLSEISACADPHAAHDNASARPNFGPLIVVLPFDPCFFSFQSGYPIHSKQAPAANVSGRFVLGEIGALARQKRVATAISRRNGLPKNQANRIESARLPCNKLSFKHLILLE